MGVPAETYQLIIRDYRVWAHLGVSEEERLNKQSLLVSITLSFSEEPLACRTDSLDNGVCYSSLLSYVEEVIVSQPCCLLEHMAKRVMDKLFPVLVGKAAKVELVISKEHPPKPNLLSPVSFCITKELV